jgi:general L-amino acid transport system permease protein
LTGAQNYASIPPRTAPSVSSEGVRMKSSLSAALQAAFVVALVAAIAAMAITAHDNLTRQGIATGFRFLLDRTGWDVGSSFIEHGPGDPYWRTFLAGLVNTLVLSALCIVLATAAGMLLALLGAGQSRILHGFARLYVWTFRNIPLIVQVFFWYHVTRLLPPVRQSIEILGCCYLSNRGLYLPHIGLDLTFTLPRLQGFNFVGGTHLSPEFMAMVAAIVAYNIAFIAEIVNSGIRAVPPQQIEAARVIGLSPTRIFWSITIPQAVRIAVPPLINQYISLTKSSSLAIAIGYTDLFAVGVIAINHTGQSVNVIAVLMLAYLCISFGISALGNAYNRALVRRVTQ